MGRTATSTNDEIHSPFVIPRSVKVAATAVRQRVAVTGIVVREEVVAWAGGPVLEVQVRDETGVICLPFFGRRSLGGVEPGVLLTAAGTVSQHRGRHVILNPQIWLRSDARPRRADSVDNRPMRTIHA